MADPRPALPDEQKQKLFSANYRYAHGFFNELEAAGREVTAQDRATNLTASKNTVRYHHQSSL